MSYVNKVILIGNLGKDPEIRYLPNNNIVVNTTIITKEFWKDKDDNKKESIEWHRIIFYNNIAKVVSKYLKKGSKIYIEGKIKNRKWIQNNEEKYITEIICNNMQMLSYNKKNDNKKYNLLDNKKEYNKNNNENEEDEEDEEDEKNEKDKEYEKNEEDEEKKYKKNKNNNINSDDNIKKYLKDLNNDDIPF